MDFEAALGKIVNGIAVVTVKTKDRRNGMTAAWFTRVSHNPPLVMVSVGRGRFTKKLLEESGYFCLNILAEGQIGLAKGFGLRSGKDADKFDGVGFYEGATGSPVLDGVAAHLECTIVGIDEDGDHVMFVGEVVEAGSSEKKPLQARAEDFA
jgi:flavin reductase (DIM6/NTAB) family NADH-FMN oxidoreductase RutF